MRFKEVTLKNYKTKLEEIEKSDVKIIRSSRYWDGPLSGVFIYNENRYWFETIYNDIIYSKERDEEGECLAYAFVRDFVILELSADQWKEEDYWNNLFEKYVGRNNNYDKDGNKNIGDLQPRDEHHKYYDMAKDRNAIDLSENNVIGWVRWYGYV